MPDTGDTIMCIVGPTAAGKSALALSLAEQRGLAILSADSRQIYRQFDIGTAKPSPDEQRRVPHYGVDVIEPQQRYSAHRWATEAAGWSDDAWARGTPPLVVGGTGLYVRAYVEPLDAVPDLDPAHRAQLAPWLETLDRAALVQWCTRLDPDRAHLGRTQLLRAIETVLLTGRRLSDQFREHVGDTRAGTTRSVRYLVVDPGPVLADRIAARVHAMVRNGFFEEVERLRGTVPSDAPAWNACGYRAVREALDGTSTRAHAIERTIIESRQYAKRQRTWFRHQLPDDAVTRINPDAADAMAMVQAWWDSAQNRFLATQPAAERHAGAPMGAADGTRS